jgi:membrane-associated phospholipid phosphatase
VLGIHWLADIIAGLAAGALSVGIAWRFTDTSQGHDLAPESEYPLLRRKPRPSRQLAEPSGFRF